MYSLLPHTIILSTKKSIFPKKKSSTAPQYPIIPIYNLTPKPITARMSIIKSLIKNNPLEVNESNEKKKISIWEKIQWNIYANIRPRAKSEGEKWSTYGFFTADVACEYFFYYSDDIFCVCEVNVCIYRLTRPFLNTNATTFWSEGQELLIGYFRFGPFFVINSVKRSCMNYFRLKTF